MSSPALAHAPSSPATPSHALNQPGSSSATPTFSGRTPTLSLPISPSPSVNYTIPLPPKYSNGLGLDDDNDDDLISTVGGGVYIDQDVDMDKQGNASHMEKEWEGNVTEFSELDSDMSLFASLKSSGGVSVAGGIIEEHEEDEESKDNGTEVPEREAAISPAQHFGGNLGSVEVTNVSTEQSPLFFTFNLRELTIGVKITASTNTYTITHDWVSDVPVYPRGTARS